MWDDPIDFRSYIKCNGIIKFDIPNSIAPVLGFKNKTIIQSMKLSDRKKQ